jgi:hypothetical protein
VEEVVVGWWRVCERVSTGSMIMRADNSTGEYLREERCGGVGVGGGGGVVVVVVVVGNSLAIRWSALTSINLHGPTT